MTSANRRRILSLLICLGAAAVGPQRGAAQVSIGVVGGLNFASLGDVEVGNLRETFDRRTGFHGGLFLDLELGLVAIRPALTYLNVGPVFEGATFLDPDAFDLNYVAIPIDVRLQLPFLLVTPYVFTGPELRSLASSNAQSEFREQLKDLVMLWGVGAGVQIGSFYPEIRYAFDVSGVTDAAFEVGGVSVVTDGAKVHMVRLSLGIGF